MQLDKEGKYKLKISLLKTLKDANKEVILINRIINGISISLSNARKKAA